MPSDATAVPDAVQLLLLLMALQLLGTCSTTDAVQLSDIQFIPELVAVLFSFLKGCLKTSYIQLPYIDRTSFLLTCNAGDRPRPAICIRLARLEGFVQAHWRGPAGGHCDGARRALQGLGHSQL